MSELPGAYDAKTIAEGLAREEGGGLSCISCGRHFAPDEVYPVEGRFFTAEKAAQSHVQKEHGNRLLELLEGENKYINLTAHQKKLFRLLAAGHSDAQIASISGVSPATVRRQRFAFREKAKQATMYLALYGLMDETRGGQEADSYLPLPEGARMLDDRFDITQQEYSRYIKNAFESTVPPRLRALPVKQKKKVAVLLFIMEQFEKGRDYTEKQVNAILEQVHPEEYVTLRRYLIEYGFMGRVADGSRYWVN